MGAEKHGSKVTAGYVGSFFQLFDWNVKSRKKVSFDKSATPEGIKQEKKNNENLPMTRLLMEEDGNVRISSAKEAGNYGSASSIDDEENVVKAPSVVARLMGLDSFPTYSTVEPNAIPPFEMQSHSGDVPPERIAELRPRKMPKSPSERFQHGISPKSANSFTVAHQKLISPIKSPRFIAPKKAANAMEAAAKFLKPAHDSKVKGKCLPASSISIKSRDLKDRSKVTQRPPRLSERPADSNAAKLLRGQSLNKSWNGSDGTPEFKASLHAEKSQEVGSKYKGKSISLALQAKVNVQKREGLGSGRKILLVQTDEGEYKSSVSSRKPAKLNAATASSVLRKNKQKQNCPSKNDKSSLKSSVSNQVGGKVPCGDGSFGRNKTNMVSVSSRISRKDSSGMVSEKEVPSSRTKKIPRNKRAKNEEFYSKKSAQNEAVLVKRGGKPFHPDVIVKEHINQSQNSRRNGMTAISFTFTSHLVKHSTLSPSSHTNNQNKNICFTSSTIDDPSTAAGKSSSSLGLNMVGGDALSILLEDKLREITSGIEPSSFFNPSKVVHATSTPRLQELASPFTITGAARRESHGKTSVQHGKVDFVGDFSLDSSLVNNQVFKVNHKFQAVEGKEECRQRQIGDARRDQDCLHHSPVSIFEASLSNGSCNSSESWDSTNGNTCSSGQEQNHSGATSPYKIPFMDVETEPSDSASSTIEGAAGMEHIDGLWAFQMSTCKGALEYVKKIIENASIIIKELALCHDHEIIDHHLFEKLESQEINPSNDADNTVQKLCRKELFDCVGEFLNMKLRRYGRSGYNTWAQGVVLLKDERLALEIFNEILLWGSMGDWMVDDLVEKDMSSRLGSWLHFEAEAFEVGVEIESEILCSLIDELFMDAS